MTQEEFNQIWEDAVNNYSNESKIILQQLEEYKKEVLRK